MKTASYLETSREMLEFIEKSPSVFHVISNVGNILKENGFIQLTEKESWHIEYGKSYYVKRNDSSIIAFRIPERNESADESNLFDRKADEKCPKGFHIVASHSDSPAFKVKEKPEMTVEKQYVVLNTEKYGGMIVSTWLDRPLSIAGRIAVVENGEIKTRLVNIDRDLLVIPNVAIHMNREMNKGIEYNPQTDMLPLFAESSENEKNSLLGEIASAADVKESDILGHDLFLYVRDKGRILGMDDEFVLSPKLDDLQSVFASVKAFSSSEPKNYINVCAVFDNEEVGSGTGQGADSTFLEDVLYRICKSLEIEQEDYLRMIADSFLISADNAHAVHPNHPEKADPTNRPYLNGGIVIKYHGSQKYTTDAVSAAKMKHICKLADIPYQTYANRSDIAGGSTLGNISTAHVSVPSVDIGLPQLAMHSAVETAGTKDTIYAINAFQIFWKE